MFRVIFAEGCFIFLAILIEIKLYILYFKHPDLCYTQRANLKFLCLYMSICSTACETKNDNWDDLPEELKELKSTQMKYSQYYLSTVTLGFFCFFFCLKKIHHVCHQEVNRSCVGQTICISVCRATELPGWSSSNFVPVCLVLWITFLHVLWLWWLQWLQDICL